MTELTDEQICAIARNTQTAEPGRDGYILPVAFARAVIAAHRGQQDAEIERLRGALQSMSRTEPCGCGCDGVKPILLKPSRYYLIAKAALKGEKS